MDVMSVNTCRSIMLLSIRTPNCFVLVKVEIMIPSLKVDDFYFDFRLIVGKGTELLIFTFVHLTPVCLAEFALVPSRMVNLLDFIVCERTITLLAFFCWAELVTVVFEVGPSLVHIIVVERTSFPFMMIYLNL